MLPMWQRSPEHATKVASLPLRSSCQQRRRVRTDGKRQCQKMKSAPEKTGWSPKLLLSVLRKTEQDNGGRMLPSFSFTSSCSSSHSHTHSFFFKAHFFHLLKHEFYGKEDEDEKEEAEKDKKVEAKIDKSCCSAYGRPVFHSARFPMNSPSLPLTSQPF